MQVECKSALCLTARNPCFCRVSSVCKCKSSANRQSFLADRENKGGAEVKAIMIAMWPSLGLGVRRFATQFVALPHGLCLI